MIPAFKVTGNVGWPVFPVVPIYSVWVAKVGNLGKQCSLAFLLQASCCRPSKPKAWAGRVDLSMGIHTLAQLQQVGPVPPGFVLNQLLLCEHLCCSLHRCSVKLKAQHSTHGKQWDKHCSAAGHLMESSTILTPKMPADFHISDDPWLPIQRVGRLTNLMQFKEISVPRNRKWSVFCQWTISLLDAWLYHTDSQFQPCF